MATFMDNKGRSSGILLGLMLALFLPAWSSAGLVVTKDAKEWAKEVISQEKQLGRLARGHRTVGVLPFVQATGDPKYLPLQKGLAVMIATDLSKVKGLTVVDRVKVQALIQELALSESGLVQEQTGPRLGKLLQAKWIVGGQYGVGKGSMDMDSKLVEVVSTELLEEIQAQGDMNKIFALEKEIVNGIIKTLGIELTTEERKAIEAPFTSSFDAFMAFSRGLDASDKGDYKKAYKEYKKALRSDPNFVLAMDAIKELADLGLLGGMRDKGALSEFLDEIRSEGLSLTDTLGSETATMRLEKPDDAEERGQVEEDLPAFGLSNNYDYY